MRRCPARWELRAGCRRAYVGSRGERRWSFRRARLGCATSATDRPPGSPLVLPFGRPGHRHRRGLGRPPGCPGARVTTRPRCQPRDQQVDRWGGARRCRQAPCHRRARGAGKSRRRPAPSRCRSLDRAGPESPATRCSGSPAHPTWWPTAFQPDRPTPARSIPACRAPTRCAVHSAWSDRRPARRRSAPRILCRRRKTGAPARSSTGRPAIAASASLRSYRLCTRVDSPPHPGQQAAMVRGDAQIRTDPVTSSTRSITTSARCGRRTSTTS